jgi:HrpA-like RNA helicase
MANGALEQERKETGERTSVDPERLLQGFDTAITSWRTTDPPLPMAQDKNISQIEAFMQNPSVHSLFLEADPGTGKTTVGLSTGFRELLRRNKNARMLVTQPRRIAVESQAEYIGNAISGGDESLKKAVDYHFKGRAPSEDSRVEFTVEKSLLLDLVKRDKTLDKYDAVFLDEVHGVRLRLLLPLLKRAQRLRAEQGRPLKIIFATGSATGIKDRVMNYFDNVKHMRVEGKKFQSKEEYVKEQEENVTEDNFVDRTIAKAKQVINDPDKKGDMLIFMPTRATIKETSDELQRMLGNGELNDPNVEIIPLVGGEEGKENYAKIHQPTTKRRIFVATNVAEEAITIPNIAHVIVTGWRRTKIAETATGIIASVLQPISKNSIKQQAGRERTGKGNVYYMFKESDLKWKFPDQDQDVDDLAEDIMTLKLMGEDDIDNFDWEPRPDQNSIDDGIYKLKLLDVLDKNEKIRSDLAEAMLNYETGDLRFSRMLVEADKIENEEERKKCKEALGVIIGLLSNEGSIFAPEFKPDEAFKEKYMQGTNSDFTMLLRIWNDYIKREKINGINPKAFSAAGRTRTEVLNNWKLKNTQVDTSPETISNMENCLYTAFAGQLLEHSENGLYHLLNKKAHGIKLDNNSVLTGKEAPMVIAGKLKKSSKGKVLAEFNMQVDPEKMANSIRYLKELGDEEEIESDDVTQGDEEEAKEEARRAIAAEDRSQFATPDITAASDSAATPSVEPYKYKPNLWEKIKWRLKRIRRRISHFFEFFEPKKKKEK